jgi:hypothetical protein
MNLDRSRQGRSGWAGATVAVIMAVIGSGAFATGCGLFGPRPEPQIAAAPTPIKTPEVHLLLRLDERRVYVVEDGLKQPPEGYLVAIGQKRWPTPTGTFQINELVENPDFIAFDFNDPKKPDRGKLPPGPNNPLGLRWIGFATAHGWQVGFHGTAKTSVLGQAVSHGCVRMANNDVVEMFKRVKLGTTVVVEDAPGAVAEKDVTEKAEVKAKTGGKAKTGAKAKTAAKPSGAKK